MALQHNLPQNPTPKLQVWLIGQVEVPVPPLQATDFSAKGQALFDAWAAFEACERRCRSVVLPKLQEADFVLTTRTDDESFAVAGADPRRILWLRGNASLLQCTGPCSDRVWLRQEVVKPGERLQIAATDPQVMRCPLCGLALRPNVLFDRDPSFVLRPHLGGSERWADFLTAFRGEQVQVYEIGVANERALLLLRKRLRRTFRVVGM